MNVLQFHSSMGCGDIIYSLPFVRHMKEKTGYDVEFYIGQSPHKKFDTFNSLYRLLSSLPYIDNVIKWHSLQWRDSSRIAYNLDSLRKQPNLRKVKYWENYFRCFNEPVKDYEYTFRPWIYLPDDDVKFDTCFHVTPSYDFYDYNFNDYLQGIRTMGFPIQVLGFYDDIWKVFDKQIADEFDNNHYDLLDFTEIISQSKDFFCNQSVGLTIAQGLGHENINLAVCKGWHSVYGLRNETILK